MEKILHFETNETSIHIIKCGAAPVLGVQLYCCLSQSKNGNRAYNVRYGNATQMHSFLCSYRYSCLASYRDEFEKVKEALKNERK